jgi:hypothetical protein
MGIELARDGRITTWDYAALYDEVMRLPLTDGSPANWQIWADAFKPRFNGLASEFKRHAPQPLPAQKPAAASTKERA